MSKCNYSGIQETEFRNRNKGTGKAEPIPQVIAVIDCLTQSTDFI